ncbi:MAG: nucleotidyltransferase domain-containing protein [Candidatus Bathycorpusculaceae bacterium]
MAPLRLRDRDAITSREGLIFRVFGYSHPPKAYICDVEYAPEAIFKSKNPKAYRNRGENVFYKFYEDEGWKLVNKAFPQYMILHEMLDKMVVGVNHSSIAKVQRPKERLESLNGVESKDELHRALQDLLKIVSRYSDLSTRDFGVFGSLLHGFYHPKFSDIDLIVYGGRKANRLRETLQELYANDSSPLKNEFETDTSVIGKSWLFESYSAKEYVWHQRRKLIYALFRDEKSGRTIKTEFEPVKEWKEIVNGYDSGMKIVQKGWVRLFARVERDDESCFIPSIYDIEPLEALDNNKEAIEACRIISYMEEFRLQAQKDEVVYVEGNLEEVMTSKGNFHQIALTYCPRYYEQVLKVASLNLQ